MKGRSKWLKTAVVNTSLKKERGPKAPKVAKQRKESFEAPVEKVVEMNLSPSEFDCKLKEVLAGRGKRGTNMMEHLAELRRLVQFSRTLGAAREVMVTMNMASAQLFDSTIGIDKMLSATVWRSVLADLMAVVQLMEKNPGFYFKSLTAEDQAEIHRAGRGELKEEEGQEEDLPANGQKGALKVAGDLATFTARLSDEYKKSLQQTDPHTPEYVSRLHDEGPLVELAKRVYAYCTRAAFKVDKEGASSMALLQAEWKYYKHSSIAYGVHVSRVRRKALGDAEFFHPSCLTATVSTTQDASCTSPGSWSGKPTCEIPDIDVHSELKSLCHFVYEHGNDRKKTRAMLCHIYHHALHDRFAQGRDLLLMSHLQDTISHADVSTQILFNRMMSQLGLCAFRAGRIIEAHGCLAEICTGARTKEILAQGIQNGKFNDRNSEQEKQERRRQMPYHMHINLELLEYCHLTAAMLLEVPHLAASRSSSDPSVFGNRKRVISKTFRRYLDYYDRQVFSGPPENTRDHVIAAAKALTQGAWRVSQDLILGLPVWNLFPGENVALEVREMIGNQIQIQALRTYLFAYSTEYDSISLNELCEMFELPEKVVHSTVSKMMISEDLAASWDKETSCIVMHPVERTKLQLLAVTFAEKTVQLVENNERMLENRTFPSHGEWKGRNNVRSENPSGVRSAFGKRGSSYDRHYKKEGGGRW